MKFLIVPGDGIGPEIVDSSLEVLGAIRQKLGIDIAFDHAECGQVSLAKYGTTLRDEDIAKARASDAVILGPMSISQYPPVAQGGINVAAQFRARLDLFANVRPNRTRAGVPSVARNMDLVLVRENLEDFYADRNMFHGQGEFMPVEGVALAVGKITQAGTARAARVAFDIARRRPRRKLSIVAKEPVLRVYHGLFVKTAKQVAADYPDVEVETLHVDAVAAYLIRSPERFDVLFMPNMYGDILSDEAAELAGSLGIAPSVNVGPDIVVACAAHGSAPDIAGRNIANPTSMIGAVALLLDELGSRRGDSRLVEGGRLITGALDAMLSSSATQTRDLGGKLDTRSFTKGVVERLRA
jgi:isocitrate/isopropylmalate dehydrogenase